MGTLVRLSGHKSRGNVDYPFIRAFGLYWGSKRYYIEDQIRKARETNAPLDAVSYNDSKGNWNTVADLTGNGSMKGYILSIAEDRYGIQWSPDPDN